MPTTCKIRPTVEMTGTVSDLRPQDYVDTLGDGVRFKRYQVGALVESVQTGQQGFKFGRTRVTVFPGQVAVSFLTKGEHAFDPSYPVKFRRFES